MDARAIGEIILELTDVTEDELNEAMRIRDETGKALAQVLVEMGAMDEKDRVRCLGRQWGVPFVDLEKQELDPEVLASFPHHIMRQYRVVPLRIQDRKVTLAMENPVDIFTIDEIGITTGLKVEPVIASGDDITAALKRAGAMDAGMRDKIAGVLDEFDGGAGGLDLGKADEAEGPSDVQALIEDAPVVRLVDMIISQGISEGASDIHIQPEPNELRIRYRVDGVLHDGPIIPKAVEPAIIARVKVLAEMDIAERRQPQDGRVSARLQGKQYDFRVSTLPGVHGEKAVLRVLDKTTLDLGLSELGFPPDTMRQFMELVYRTYGILLVCGPTGSGKSTTLYSVLRERNTPDVNIITVEDPVEYQLPGLTQTHVSVKAGLTFASVLRSMLRQDPNIIMVGEIRDGETALIATEAALTGHLVLSTIHTNDAPGSVTRLSDMKVEPFLIASAVIGALAQRLVRRVCQKCAEPFTPPQKALNRLGITEEELSTANFMQGAGCEACSGTGYKRRIGIFELMTMTDEIRTAVLNEAAAHTIRRIAREQGMRTLEEDGMAKVLAGITTPSALLAEIHAQ